MEDEEKKNEKQRDFLKHKKILGQQDRLQMKVFMKTKVDYSTDSTGDEDVKVVSRLYRHV